MTPVHFPLQRRPEDMGPLEREGYEAWMALYNRGTKPDPRAADPLTVTMVESTKTGIIARVWRLVDRTWVALHHRRSAGPAPGSTPD